MSMMDTIKTHYVNKELSVVISHGDADHHSYIKKVLDKLTILEPNIKYYFYLGGIKSQYPSTLTKFIDDLLPVRRQCVYYTNTDGKLSPMISASYVVDVLAWPNHTTGSTSEKKNSNSLILKITFGTYSILLTGDATENTFDCITDKTKLKANLLMVPHHGAKTMGSDSEEKFITHAEPSVVVFSAAKNQAMLHPDASVVSKYLCTNSLMTLPLHQFSHSGDEIPDMQHFMYVKGNIGAYTTAEPIIVENYRGVLTRHAIYHTINTGTMTFEFGSRITVNPQQPYISIFPKNLTYLVLSDMGITTQELHDMAGSLIGPPLTSM